MSDESKIKVIFGDGADEEQPQAPSEAGEEPQEPVAPPVEDWLEEETACPELEPELEAEPVASDAASEEHDFKINDRRFWNLSEEELEEDEETPTVPSYVEQLEQKVEEKDRQLREYIAAYKKEVGEGLERTKERLQRDADLRLQRARDKMALPMLEVLDALERSIQAAESSDNFDALLDGVGMVQKLMVQKLEEMGLSRVPGVGQPFDPNMHEALAVAPVDDPEQDNTVVAEFKPGFALGERVIRPAQVQVGKLQS